MSAAAARRKKQLAARQKEKGDAVEARLDELLSGSLDEATAYEALQLAQSLVKKREHSNDYTGATELAYSSSLAILKQNRVSVASQLLALLVETLRETQTECTSDPWIARILELQTAHEQAMDSLKSTTTQEITRLTRLQRDFLRKCIHWSADLGPIRFGHVELQELLGKQSWKLVELESANDQEKEEGEEDVQSLQCDTVVHMALAEKPDKILEFLKTLPPPKPEEIKMGHKCPPADRDALLTRSLLVFCAVENLRDANILLRSYVEQVEDRPIDELAKSYMNKEDGFAPSHAVFGSMLLRVCEKDTRTGPLFSWLLRSFKKELDLLYKPQVVQSYTTKIGKVYFNIQPPPSMMSMMENMMSMMGGGGGMQMNPAMMQAALAQAQGM